MEKKLKITNNKYFLTLDLKIFALSEQRISKVVDSTCQLYRPKRKAVSFRVEICNFTDVNINVDIKYFM